MIENFELATKFTQNLFEISDARLLEIEKEAILNNVPILTRDVLKYMLFIVRNEKFKNILEIGTATGYSGIFLSQIAIENNGTFTSIEIDKERYNQAINNFKKMNLFNENVSLILGDALDEIPKLSQQGKIYDFIFIDASKGQYNNFFKLLYPILSKNGIMFIDNLLFRGMVTLEHNKIPKRYKTIVTRLKAFINELNENENFVLLPFGDGVGILKK